MVKGCIKNRPQATNSAPLCCVRRGRVGLVDGWIEQLVRGMDGWMNG